MHNQINGQNGQKNEMHRFKQILSANLKYTIIHDTENSSLITYVLGNKGNNKTTELRTILQRESQNS
jgi:hypothetical protein